MTRLATAPGVSFGLIEGRAIFLDVRSDRYFALPGDLAEPFADVLSRGGSIDPDVPETRRLLATQLFILWENGPALRPVDHRPPDRAPEESCRPSFRPGDFVEAWLLIARAARAIRSTPLHAILATLKTTRVRAGEESDQPDLHLLARRFHKARSAVPAPPSCLQDSLALRQWLSRRGYGCTLVLAARLEPFAAHCWIESGGVVLNDAPERIASFVPVGVFP